MDPRMQELLHDLDSDIEDVRKAAVASLAQQNDPALLPHLERMANDPSPAVQYFARRAVDELRRKQAAPGPSTTATKLFELLKSPDVATRFVAAQAAAQLRDPQVLAALLAALEAERDVRIIATLVRSLGTFRDPRATQKLLELMHHSDARVRSNTVDAAMALDDPQIFDAVCLLATDAANRVRGSVALFLAAHAPERVQGIVREMIESDLVWMKDSAIYVMHLVRAPWCAPFLEQLTNQPGLDAVIVQKATRALQQLRMRLAATTPGAVDQGASSELSGELRAALRIQATEASDPASGADPAAAPRAAMRTRTELLAAMNGSNAGARLGALEELAEILDDETMVRVELALRDLDTRVRNRARDISANVDRLRRERDVLQKLGRATWEALLAQRVDAPALLKAAEPVRHLSEEIDRGHQPADTVVNRDRALVALARAALELFSQRQLEGSPLAGPCQVAQQELEEARAIAPKPMEPDALMAAVLGPPAGSPPPAAGATPQNAARTTRRMEAAVVDASMTASGELASPAATGTRKTPFVSGQVGRKTARYAELPAPGLLQRLNQYRMLVISGAVLLMLVIGVPVLMLSRSQIATGGKTKPRKSGPAPPEYFQPEDVMKSGKAESYVGKNVRWVGKPKELDADRKRMVVVTSGGGEFEAEFQRPFDRHIKEDMLVTVDGTVRNASSSHITVAALSALGQNLGLYVKAPVEPPPDAGKKPDAPAQKKKK